MKFLKPEISHSLGLVLAFYKDFTYEPIQGEKDRKWGSFLVENVLIEIDARGFLSLLEGFMSHLGPILLDFSLFI